MRPILPMLVIAALNVEAPALSAALTASALNAEVACTTDCNALCKRCVGAACAKEECAAACEARRRVICSAFPKPEEFDWAGNRAEFKIPGVVKLPDVAIGGVLAGQNSWVNIPEVGPSIVPYATDHFQVWTEGSKPPAIHLPDAPPPLAPASPPTPISKADGGESPITRITDTRSAPLVHPGEETAGYGLYTYVLLRQSADRDSHFVKEIVATAPSASGGAPTLRAQTDLMLIPANPCPSAPPKSAEDCAANLVDAVASDPKASYNYEESNTILEELCIQPPKQIANFCHEPFGKGPFLFTYARPVSKMNPIPPPFLFFDFTTHDEAEFPDYIYAYEAVLKSDDFTDDSKLKTLQLRILDVYNRARGAAGPTVEGAVKLIGLFFPSKEQD
jgi:hypothetical protein